jgi:HD-GYP domain-containing protein (c-di-GMP phosphodiesterase class II)
VTRAHFKRPSTTRVRLLLTAGLLAAAVATAAHLSGVVQALEMASVDARFEKRGAQPPDDIVVVAVDDVTFSDLGVQWPLPRSVFGRAVKRLHAAGAREIVLDVQFTEPTEPREDLALYDAIERAGGAVLATSESDGRGHTNVLGGDENLEAIGARAAASNLPGERGGVIRHFTHSMANLPTLAVVVAGRQGHAARPDEFPRGGAYIDFRGASGSIPTVSLSALLRGDVDPDRLRGKIAVVGASAPTLHDRHATAAGGELMAGPEVQANAIWTLLNGLPLRDAGGWLSLMSIFAGSLLIPLLALQVRAVVAALAAPAAGLGYVALAQAAFEAGTVLPVAAPLSGLALATIATVVASHVLETLERQRIAARNHDLERDMRDAELEIIQRLGRAVESRDEETGEHIDRITTLAHQLALAAGLDAGEAERLRRASAMHDVGKIAIPDSILRKPGPLDPAERAIMQRHTTIGAELLAGSRSPLVQMAETIARTHHERWDGSGYPAGLAGEAIPLAGRITALCDVFDALVSPRAYKPAWPVELALEEIRSESGRHFDPELTALFLALAPDLHGSPEAQRDRAVRSAPGATASVTS